MLAWTLSQERGMTLISPLHSIGNLICNCRQCRPMARKNPNFVLKCALWGKKTVLKLYIVIHSFQKLESRLRRQFVLFRRKIVRERENYQFCNMLEIKVKRHLRRPKCVEKSCITCSHNKHTSWFALTFNVQMMHFLDFWLIYALLSSSRFTHFFRRFF